ncbi:MAG TPA: hypothetical protein VD973_09455 [Symbiobacteriaceae bacterium]|nr:hypothetical protein [Symbiobacteriaceae bacterium]
MLQQLNAAATAGTIKITHLYLGHIKKDNDRKILAHSDAMEWEAAEPSIRAVLEQHLYQAIEGEWGVVNFPCMYHGQVLSVAKVASEDFDRTRNRPTVEILEAIRDNRSDIPDWPEIQGLLIRDGNNLAYKVLSAGAIKNHLVAVLKFSVIPQLGAAAIPFVFTTLVDLDDRHESFFDEKQGKFITTELHNIIKRSNVSRAAFFPCLDEEGKETADLLVYAGGAAGVWFRALEMAPQLSPQAEGKALLKMIAEQAVGADVQPDLFQKLFINLGPFESPKTVKVNEVMTALEKSLGMGVDRLGFQVRWESAFGDLGYEPQFASLFGSDEVDPPVLKLTAGATEFKVPIHLLSGFKQFNWNNATYLLMAIPQLAQISMGSGLDIRLKPADLTEIRTWLKTSKEV